MKYLGASRHTNVTIWPLFGRRIESFEWLRVFIVAFTVLQFIYCSSFSHNRSLPILKLPLPFFGLQIMSSFVSQIMQPGGGLLLIPFVRLIIGTLLVLTLAGFLAGVARIHMAVLSFLSAGLLFSISMFESEYKKAQQYSSSSQSSSQQAATGGGKPAKSD